MRSLEQLLKHFEDMFKDPRNNSRFLMEKEEFKHKLRLMEVSNEQHEKLKEMFRDNKKIEKTFNLMVEHFADNKSTLNEMVMVCTMVMSYFLEGEQRNEPNIVIAVIEDFIQDLQAATVRITGIAEGILEDPFDTENDED